MTLSVLSLNIWHDEGPWRQRAARIRAWIERLDPDLIGFQEVLRGPEVDLAAELLEGRGFHLDFVPAQPFWRDEALAFGNSVASRWPIRERHPLRLPDRGGFEKRAALTAIVEAPLGDIAFTTTHLHWRLHHGDTRRQQVAALAAHVLAHRPRDGFPPIVVGDFNAEPDSDEMRFLRGAHVIDGQTAYFNDAWWVAGGSRDPLSGCTWSNRNAYARADLEHDKRIDYVYAGYPMRDGRGLVEHCRVVCDDEQGGVWPSDHFGVYAELRSQPLSPEERGGVPPR